ncbi:type II toxin-antitoxin system HicB family antitoxin [Cupriavidus sp. WGtm5]|uniref:type II toxin-antitoxin system HicB family antitoxin n=1 Tax=Cupriavidus sp. WGtm5 TaxID=2919926 RepID=UPI002091A5AE|nr:type II toxin-antitoxin system HicB family antitoxin [Cupriavidus sp. WGtm5]MCO4892644.1 type II toxin-antitoxin system HicB family antitoxin [Cupriavidus sp. WGtm5]
MLYPVHIEPGDATHAHGVSFPDFPGCFSAADEWADIPANAQEAVEAHFADGEAIPAPSAVERWLNDPDYQGGVWMLIDIDLSRVNTKAVRVNISLPERLVHAIDDAAKSRHMTRSAFLALAAQHEMDCR